MVLLGIILVIKVKWTDGNSPKTRSEPNEGVIERGNATNSIVGIWDVTLAKGDKGLAIIRSDHTITTDFGLKWHWEQETKRKVMCIETSQRSGERPRKFEGDIDPTGNKIVWTRDDGEKCSYVRRAPANIVAPSIAGSWQGTFQDGKIWDFFIFQDGTMIGDNGFQGYCALTGHRLIIIDANNPLPGFSRKWEGTIDRARKAFSLANAQNGFAITYVRR